MRGSTMLAPGYRGELALLARLRDPPRAGTDSVGRRHLAVVVVEVRLRPAEHPVVVLAAGPDAHLVTIRVDTDRWHSARGEHHHARRLLALVPDVVGTVGPGRNADHIACAGRRDPGGRAYLYFTDHHQQPFLHVLVVIRAQGLPRRQLEQAHGELLAAGLLAEWPLAAAIALRVLIRVSA